MLRIIIVLACALHAAPSAAWTTIEDWAAIVAAQQRKQQPLPALSSYGAGLDMADAYRVQRLVIEALEGAGPLTGHALALTRPWTQQRFGERTPVSCLLTEADRVAPGAALDVRAFRRPTVAYGLGFVTREMLRQPVPDAARMRGAVAAVVPMLLLADYGFESATGMSGEDYVAVNCGLAGYVTGKPLASVDPALVNTVFVELARDGEVIDRGKAVNVQGDQYTALMWLVNKVIGQGYEIPRGALLATGPIGDEVTAGPGRYTARFRGLSDLAVTLEGGGASAQARRP